MGGVVGVGVGIVVGGGGGVAVIVVVAAAAVVVVVVVGAIDVVIVVYGLRALRLVPRERTAGVWNPHTPCTMSPWWKSPSSPCTQKCLGAL